MRKVLKLIHTLAATGMIGALAAHIILLASLPESSSLAEYTAVRHGIGRIAQWLLLPSLGAVLVSGLLAMAFSDRYYNAGWAWLKLGTGVLAFEGTLLTVQGPAVRAAAASRSALEGNLDPAEIESLLRGEWGSLWVILAIAVLNVVLAIWRPRLGRDREV